ncbi:MAG: type II secretion system protein [Candidatus Omnitrophota bacterium]
MKRLNVSGFSMIELLVVLLIIGILAAVAAPMYLSNTSKARVSEAVAGAGAIRSGERTYMSQNGSLSPLTITTSADASLYFGTASGNRSSDLGVQIHGNKYFSPESYRVGSSSKGTFAWSGTVVGTTEIAPQDFLITVTGANSSALSGSNLDGASSNADVSGYIIQMDNSGRVIWTEGTSSPAVWAKY